MARLPYVIPYDPDFLGGGFQVPLPKTCCNGKLVNSGEVLDYIHYSLVMHQDRKAALYTAHNIDYSQKNRADGSRWDVDRRIEAAYQTDNDAYHSNPWDRGHLVRRDAVVWGDRQRAQDASDSTYYYPNAALQHRDFNQSNSRWLGLEDWILSKAGPFASRLCVFTGPIYTELDEQTPRGYTIPSAFWKIVVLRDPTAEGEDLAAVAFLMKQNENWRKTGRRALEDLTPYHVSIAEIEAYTGLNFGAIKDVDEFDWQQVRFRDRSLMPAIRIDGADDIVFSGDKRRAKGIRAYRKYVSGQATDLALVTEVVASKKMVEKSNDCGCGGKCSTDLTKEIVSLKSQTTALCEIIETLIENNNGQFEKRSLERLRAQMFRIVGGQIVTPNEYPECAAIGYQQGYFCTGVLVHPRVVLTAAHCADSITKVLLRARQIIDTNNAEIIDVQRVIVHPEYSDFQTPWHDIAVLILAEDASVQPVPIATEEEIAVDDSLVLVGFGSDSPDGLTGFGTKRKTNVNLSVYSSEEDTLIGQQEHGFDINYEFHGGNVGSGQDTCNGDSGGPAYIITSSGEKKVAGLTSRAAHSSIHNCGDGGIYTRIAVYNEWLYEVTDGMIGKSADTDNGNGQEEVDGLYISASLPNPAGPDAGNEWIEVSNGGKDSLPLSGYKLKDKQGGTFELEGILQKGATLRVNLPNNHAIKLANRGDEINLLKESTLVHSVNYQNAGSGQIIEFDAPQKDVSDTDTTTTTTTNTNTGCEGCGNNQDECCHEIDPDFTPGAIRC